VPSYTRRQLKEDKFAETAQDAVHWASGHRRGVIWVVALVLIAVIAASGLWVWHGRQTEQANIELSKAMRTFTAPLVPAGTPAGDSPSFSSIAERGKEAEKQFRVVADKFPYTKPGQIAGYLAGSAAFQAGDNAGAERQLKAASGLRDKDIAALAKMALGTVYRSTGRQADAAILYKELQDHPTDTVSKAQAQLEMAEMYESSDPQQAASIYQQIQKDNPNSPAAQIAAAKLAGAKQ
jgi:tetratricopeptide (TPR) repeat protein